MDLETSQRDERNEGRQEATCLRQGDNKSKLQVIERDILRDYENDPGRERSFYKLKIITKFPKYNDGASLNLLL